MLLRPVRLPVGDKLLLALFGVVHSPYNQPLFNIPCG